MLFNSYVFIFIFLPLSVVVFWLISGNGNHRSAIIWLVVCSLFFYGWWKISYLLLLTSSIFFNFCIGNFLLKKNNKVFKKSVLIFGVVVNLSTIGYFKYSNFFISCVNDIFGFQISTLNIILPLAISFFTFQQIAFLVDVYNDSSKKYNFIDYFFFVSFFPQLIAGPIVHHKELIPQIHKKKLFKFHIVNINIGLSIFFIGLFKKVLIADGLSNYATPIFLAAEKGITLNFFEGWIGSLAYTFQLYFDFSGYSDMAIGIARMFGFKLPLNFNSPYKAENIISFWRRWHITLSRFLRDYIYIPLGGNRKGHFRRYINIMATMVLGGLWHGAGWTFILWGALHGFYLTVNHLFIKVNKTFFKFSSDYHILRYLSKSITFTSVVLAWVFFRAQSVNGALNILKSMVGLNGISLPIMLNGRLGIFEIWIENIGVSFDGFSKNQLIPFHSIIWIFIILIFVFYFPNTQQIMAKFKPAIVTYKEPNIATYKTFFLWRPSLIWAVGIGLISTLSILSLSRVSEFLYFQF